MAYDVRSVTTTSGSGNSFTLTSPAGATSTDGLFVCVTHASGITIDGPPLGGWSLVATAFAADTTTRVLQTASLATSGPWTFTLSDISNYSAAAVAIQTDSAVIGAQRPVPDAYATKIVAATTGSFVFPTFTPTNTGDVVLLVGGWGRHTTMTPPGGTTERVDLSSGPGNTDKHLWVGSQSAATTGGVTFGAVTVTNDNPSGFAAGEQSMVAVSFMSVAPPTSWTGDFETGDLSQYQFVIQAAPDRITIQTDTPRQGTKYAHFFAQDNDVYPLTSTENPRAQLVSPRILFPGTERWLQWSTRFPADFPAIPPSGWLVFTQYHGPPYFGSPSVGFGVTGEVMNIERNISYNFDTIWTAPLVRGQWIDFVLRVNFQTDETGFIELWVNRVQQVFKGGVRRLYMRTVEPDQTTGLEFDPALYRKVGMFEPFSRVAIDHDAFRFDATAPSSLTTGALQTAPPVRRKVVA